MVVKSILRIKIVLHYYYRCNYVFGVSNLDIGWY